MMKLPSTSLGYTCAKLMNTLGFHSHFYRDKSSLDNETDYVTVRVKKTNYLYHVITGFDMVIGEVGTIALNVSQYGYPAFMLINLVALTAACFSRSNKD